MAHSQFNITEIDLNYVKQNITKEVLSQLPEWFYKKSIPEYTRAAKSATFFAVYANKKAIGFIAVKPNNSFTVEIVALGIIKCYHRKGIGEKLINEVSKKFYSEDYKLLMVKTLSDIEDCEPYRRTRAFYHKCGFMPLMSCDKIWDINNPCLIMVKILKRDRREK